jgi:hypothetical protein
MTVPRGAPKGKKEFERFEDVTIDDLTIEDTLALGTLDTLTVNNIDAVSGTEMVIGGADGFDVEVQLGDDDGGEDFHIADVLNVELFKVSSNGIVTLEGGATLDNSTSASELKLTEDNVKVVGTRKHIGEWTTRNAADDSMYNSIAASSGHERGMKVAYDIVSNDGGYFDALYANVRSGGITGGELRAVEAKASIAHDMSNSAIATGVYAKVAVANAAQIDTAIGVDVLLEETGSGAITSGIGVRIQGGAGAIDYAVDAAGLYRKGALKVPKGEAGAISAANLATGFGITEGAVAGDDCIVGLYTDTGDGNAVSLVVKAGGLYKYIKLTDAS